jgi:pilus assembly protein CpaF
VSGAIAMEAERAGRPDDPLERRLVALAAELRELLVERRRAAAVDGGADRALRADVEQLVAERAALLSPASRARLLERVLRDTVGLGPIEELLADATIDEVLVNGHEQVWIERDGLLERSAVRFRSEVELLDVIERVLGPLGRRVDELSPIADGRLADGSRVNVVIPPLAVDGPALSIRRFGRRRPGPEELVERGAIPAEVMDELRAAVAGARTLLISGGTGSGKTTVLNALSVFIGAGERVITIEDAAELRLNRSHVVRLETRPPSVEGAGGVAIRDLVRNALRMRPDRIVIGEVRGAEAMDLLIALNTGHRGALSTVHANSPADALRRIEMLALLGGVEVPYEVLRSQLAGAIDLILHLERDRRGERRAVALAEVVGTAAGAGVRLRWER